jgi:hypothetical protein
MGKFHQSQQPRLLLGGNTGRLRIVEGARNPASWRYRVSNFPKIYAVLGYI